MRTLDGVPHPPADDWGDLSYEGARRNLARIDLGLTPAQRLAWLEEAIELARRAGALPGELDPTE